MVTALRALYRLLRVLGWVVWGMAVVHTRFGGWSAQRRRFEVQQWSHRMLQAMGVQLRVVGEAPQTAPCWWWPIMCRGWTFWC